MALLHTDVPHTPPAGARTDAGTPPGPFPVEVVRRRDIAAGVVELVLARAGDGPGPDGEAPPFSWTPGAHIDLEVAPGEVRQYSLCGDPDDRARLTIAVQVEQDGRGGSRAVGAWRTGHRTTVHALRNTFPLDPDPPSAPGTGRCFVIAGGIGITPLLPMARHLAAAGRPLRLLYGARTEAAMAYRRELLDEFGDSAEFRAQDRDGLPDLAAFLAGAGPDDVVYACGPTGLLDAVEAVCAGLPCGLRTERFDTAGTGGAAGTGDAPTGGTPFRVRLARSGREVEVGAGESVLDAVRAAGVRVLSSCREGNCGTCETAVLGGEPEHRDEFLTEDEQAANDTMMICVSRSRSAVLDLDL